MTETLTCPSLYYEPFDKHECGANAEATVTGYGYWDTITVRNIDYRTTADPGHAFMFSSNDCTGRPLIRASYEDNYNTKN